MISALTFAVANHSPKGRESQLSVTVDDFEEAQEQKEPGEQREQSLAEKRVLCASSFSEPPYNRRNHRKSVQWARRLSRLGPRPTPRSLERTSQQRKGLLPRSERQELAELVKNRMKNLGLSTAGYGRGLVGCKRKNRIVHFLKTSEISSEFFLSKGWMCFVGKTRRIWPPSNVVPPFPLCIGMARVQSQLEINA